MAKKKTKYTKAELKKFEANILKKIAEVNDSIEGVRSTTNPSNSVFMNEICEVSGELISEERLMEVPNATKSVINKEKKKLNLI